MVMATSRASPSAAAPAKLTLMEATLTRNGILPMLIVLVVIRVIVEVSCRACSEVLRPATVVEAILCSHVMAVASAAAPSATASMLRRTTSVVVLR